MEAPLLIRLSPTGIFTGFASTYVRMFIYKIIIKAKAKVFAVLRHPIHMREKKSRRDFFKSAYPNQYSPLIGSTRHPSRGKPLDQFEKFHRDFFPKENRKPCCILPGYFLESVQKIIPKKIPAEFIQIPGVCQLYQKIPYLCIVKMIE